MTKTVFILVWIMQGSFGEDLFSSRVYEDLARCEYQRQVVKYRGMIAPDKCAVMHMTIN